MSQAVNCMPILFADDTCLIFSAPNLAFLTTIINKELQNLLIWFDFNKLTINPSKSNFLIIPPKLNKPFPQTNVFLNIGTMNGRGRGLEDMMERRNVDILCLQETKWKKSKARNIGGGCKIFYNGADGRKNGIGIVVRE